MRREIKVYKGVLTEYSQGWVGKVRELLGKRLLLNLIGSAGSGKTSLLEAIIPVLSEKVKCGVLEGDVATARDAERIGKMNIPVSQIVTEGVCHLEASLIYKALEDMLKEFPQIEVVFVENVGNLICPAEFDIGEHFKIAVLSVTEGDDKPLKYPLLFNEARCVVITKIDLIPYVKFSIEDCIRYILSFKSDMPVFKVSAFRGDGIKELCNWIVDTYRRIC